MYNNVTRNLFFEKKKIKFLQKKNSKLLPQLYILECIINARIFEKKISPKNQKPNQKIQKKMSKQEQNSNDPIIRTCSTTLTTIRLSTPKSSTSTLSSRSSLPPNLKYRKQIRNESPSSPSMKKIKPNYNTIRLRIIHNESIWICRWITTGLILINSLWLIYIVFICIRDHSENIITQTMIIISLLYGLFSFMISMILWRRLWSTNHYTSFALFNISFILFIIIELLQISYWFIVRFTPTNIYHNWETLSFYSSGFFRLISYLELIMFMNSTKLSSF